MCQNILGFFLGKFNPKKEERNAKELPKFVYLTSGQLLIIF